MIILISSRFLMNFCKTSQNAVILKKSTYQRIATVDLQQITQSSFKAHEFKEKCYTVLHPPYQRFERFGLYAIIAYILREQ